MHRQLAAGGELPCAVAVPDMTSVAATADMAMMFKVTPCEMMRHARAAMRRARPIASADDRRDSAMLLRMPWPLLCISPPGTADNGCPQSLKNRQGRSKLDGS